MLSGVVPTLQAQNERQQLEEKMAGVEKERHSAQQELIALHKQSADDKRAALADTDTLRQAAEEREARVQVRAVCTPTHILATKSTRHPCTKEDMSTVLIQRHPRTP